MNQFPGFGMFGGAHAKSSTCWMQYMYTWKEDYIEKLYFYVYHICSQSLCGWWGQDLERTVLVCTPAAAACIDIDCCTLLSEAFNVTISIHIVSIVAVLWLYVTHVLCVDTILFNTIFAMQLWHLGDLLPATTATTRDTAAAQRATPGVLYRMLLPPSQALRHHCTLQAMLCNAAEIVWVESHS